MFVILRKRLYSVDVLYYIPQTLILQEFVWQVDDVAPRYPRIHRFLDYWHDHIDAKIHSIKVCECDSGFSIVDFTC
jgi:uncharacterized protein Usg